MKKVLFITYDGLTDPLGQSQILTYIEGLIQRGYQFDILSFEKADRLFSNGKEMKVYLDSLGVSWYHYTFGKAGSLIAKAMDLRKMKQNAIRLVQRNKYDLIHCRSYQAAETALKIKARYGTPYLFDMRGFWVDERVDGKAWDKSRIIYRFLYQHYKNIERKMLKHADGIISLTEKAKSEILRWNIEQLNKDKISVIPCSADENHFNLVTIESRRESRSKLGIPEDALVIGYLGSVGSWYLLPEMLWFFKRVKNLKKEAIFLFVTQSDKGQILQKATQAGLDLEDIVITSGSRNEVPGLIHAFDCGISFIMPSYSKIASSPTKMGELLISGIPIVVNSGVGDVKEIMDIYGTGALVENFSEKEVDKAITKLFEATLIPGEQIRNKALGYYNISNAFEKYAKMYNYLWRQEKK